MIFQENHYLMDEQLGNSIHGFIWMRMGTVNLWLIDAPANVGLNEVLRSEIRQP